MKLKDYSSVLRILLSLSNYHITYTEFQLAHISFVNSFYCSQTRKEYITKLLRLYNPHKQKNYRQEKDKPRIFVFSKHHAQTDISLHFQIKTRIINASKNRFTPVMIPVLNCLLKTLYILIFHQILTSNPNACGSIPLLKYRCQRE